jgi:2-amino-4-hydroxy-6-hydroxymethyldihydropteridine diphosphokinase
VQILEYAPKVEGFLVLHDIEFDERGNAAPLAVIALGSNLGNSAEILRQTMVRLQQLSDVPLLKSSLWQTSPVDCPAGSPAFVNAVVGLSPRSGETPESLLAKLQGLEKAFGRQRKKVLNEPRRLDLDLVAFGNEMRNTPALMLPHPRAGERRFVLQPLAEIAPDLILPGQPTTVANLLAALTTRETLLRLEG